MPSVNVAKAGCSSATLIRRFVGLHAEAVWNTSGRRSPRTATACNRGRLEQAVAEPMEADLTAGSTAPVAEASIAMASTINAPAPNRQTVARSSIWPTPRLSCLITIHPASKELKKPPGTQAARAPLGHHPKQMNRQCSSNTDSGASRTRPRRPSLHAGPTYHSRARQPFALTPAPNREWTTGPSPRPDLDTDRLPPKTASPHAASTSITSRRGYIHSHSPNADEAEPPTIGLDSRLRNGSTLVDARRAAALLRDEHLVATDRPPASRRAVQLRWERRRGMCASTWCESRSVADRDRAPRDRARAKQLRRQRRRCCRRLLLRGCRKTRLG